MKKALYILLLLAEAVIDFLAISLAWTNLSWFPCMVIIVVWAILFVWQILMLIKTTDVENKRKIRRRIALVMLVPILGFIMMFIYLFIGLARVI